MKPVVLSPSSCRSFPVLMIAQETGPISLLLPSFYVQQVKEKQKQKIRTALKD